MPADFFSNNICQALIACMFFNVGGKGNASVLSNTSLGLEN